MERTSTSKKQKTIKESTIIGAYISYVLTHGHEPPSVFLFAKELKLKESDFYNYFSSFRSLENGVWLSMFGETVKRLNDDKVYEGYSAREKLLAFYYTWIEVLKGNRSFVEYCMKKAKKTDIVPGFMKGVKSVFVEYVETILNEGMQNEEVLERPVLSKRYADGIWVQFLFVLHFWMKDDSGGFEKTDAAIEKAVNLSFDLMGKGPLDALVDFAKFLYQNR